MKDTELDESDMDLIESDMDLCSLSSKNNLSPNWSSTSFDDLPAGLVADILSRLPVKTIVQSTPVCKIWYSIIKNPSFISLHLSRSISDPSNYYIFLIHTFASFVTVITDNHLLTRNPDLNFPFEIQSKSQEIIGTCNGLVCLTDSVTKFRGRDIYLINPFIHKYKKLVVESSCYADFIGEFTCHTGEIEVGFGYSEVENDYKVVRILSHYSDTEPCVRTTKVEIYSLKSGKWKGIDVSIEMPPYNSPISAHGRLYWLCYIPKADKPLLPDRPDGYLLCFDLKDEVFSKIKLPTTYYQLSSTWHNGIFAKNDSIVVVLFTKDRVSNFSSVRICLLVLGKDIGGQLQWKEFYYESADFNPVYCIGFSGRGRLIFVVDWEYPTWNMVAVDLDNSCAIEKLALDFTDIFGGATDVLESLVLFSD